VIGCRVDAAADLSSYLSEFHSCLHRCELLCPHTLNHVTALVENQCVTPVCRVTWPDDGLSAVTGLRELRPAIRHDVCELMIVLIPVQSHSAGIAENKCQIARVVSADPHASFESQIRIVRIVEFEGRWHVRHVVEPDRYTGGRMQICPLPHAKRKELIRVDGLLGVS